MSQPLPLVNNNIQFGNNDIDILYITNILPKWKTEIIDIKRTTMENLQVQFAIAARTEEEIKLWLDELQEKNKTKYVIKSTDSVKGQRVKFKQRLHCHHNTVKSSVVYDPTLRRGTKNTNCPSKITITLHVIEKHYKTKKKNPPDPEMPCEICFIVTHNHGTQNADALRFRKVSKEVIDKLLELYKNGHTPATALESIKMDISLLQDNFKISADRKYCPDYNYCYYIYRQEFKKTYGPLEFNTVGKEFLQRCLADFNKSTGNNESTKIIFHESDYIICICPPLFRRVHERIIAASELVFIDSTGTIDHDGSRIFVMLTHTECGGLPLGIIITSSESQHILTLGFKLFKSMVGSTIFGGNVDGPEVFMTDDSASERAALTNVFEKSKCLLCTFHVLQSIWRWLMKSKNEVPQPKQAIFFQKFRAIVYARTKRECEDEYIEAKMEAKDHPKYLNYIEGYWARRELWAWCFRNNLAMRGNNTNNYCEAAMRILKDKIFDRVEAFNLTQMVDFLLTKLMIYYESRLLDAAHNQMAKNIMKTVIKLPPPGLIERIQVITDHVVLVPSETTSDLFYVVNTEVLMCTCFFQGNICKHIDWACLLVESDKYKMVIDNVKVRNNFYIIATGSDPPQDWLKPLFGGDYETSNEISPNGEEVFNNNMVKFPNKNEKVETNMDYEEYLQHGQNVLTDITTKLQELLLNYADEITPALETFRERLLNFKTKSAIVSSLASFGKDYRRKNRLKKIPVQPTALSRRTTVLSGKNCSKGGRPREHTISVAVKRNKHNLSMKLKKNLRDSTFL